MPVDFPDAPDPAIKNIRYDAKLSKPYPPQRSGLPRIHQQIRRLFQRSPGRRTQQTDCVTGMFAVGSQMRFALALHRVMKSRFPAELNGQNPAFPLNLKTTFQLVNGELKAYPKLT